MQPLHLFILVLAARCESSFKAAFGGAFTGFEDSSPASGVPGRIIGFVNFENDFQNELLLLSKDQKEVSIFNSKSAKRTVLPFAPLDSSEYIVNAIAADFNNDGYLDIALVSTIFTLLGSEESSFLRLGLGNGSSIIPTGKSKMPISLSQPFVADISGSLLPTLLGYTLDQPSTLVSFTFDAAGMSKYDFITKPFLLDGPSCKVAHPHSSAFVDLNGDCLADLLLFCVDEKTRKNYIQIWTANVQVSDFKRQNEGGYLFAQQYDLPDGTGQVSFADMNADGTIDLVFPVCVADDCSIHILYNLQIPTCGRTVNKGTCRDPHDLCVADPKFSFAFDSEVNHYTLPIKKAVLGNRLLTSDDTFTGTLPLSLKIGDFNNDGYPDILLVANQATTFTKIRTAQILESKPYYNGKRDFQLVYNGIDQISKIKSVIGAAFLDFNNDGALDLVLIHQEGGGPSFSIFINKYYFDAFFFKTCVLNGVCLGAACPPIADLVPSLHPNISLLSTRPYGVNYAGASLKVAITDTKGTQRVSQSAQLPSSAYQPLLSAWNVIGLGRTNNYVDDLFVGVSRREIANHTSPSFTTRHVNSYHGIIPNAAIVISPFEPALIREMVRVENIDASSETWRLELYMNPSSTTTAIILVLVVVLFLLACVIGFLEVLERREDLREKQQLLHTLNFDAL